jgi:hypothetical protein
MKDIYVVFVCFLLAHCGYITGNGAGICTRTMHARLLARTGLYTMEVG